jgi:hypothetical protein
VGKAVEFASKYGLSLLEQCSSGDLEKKYFMTPEGKLKGRINGTHCIVTVKKA